MPRTAAQLREAVAIGRRAPIGHIDSDVLYTQQRLVRTMLRQLVVCAIGWYAHIRHVGEGEMRNIAYEFVEPGDAFASIHACSRAHQDPEALLRVAYFIASLTNAPIDLMDPVRTVFADELAFCRSAAC